MSRAIEIINELESLSKELKQLDADLSSDLSNKDKEIVDLYHYMELTDLDVFRGFKAYKDLQKCLRERRIVKDELDLVSHAVKQTTLCNATDSCANKLTSIALTDKKYTPRIRTDLFNDDVFVTEVEGDFIIKAEKDDKILEFDSYTKAANYLRTTHVAMYAKCDCAKVEKKIKKACRTHKKYNGISWYTVKKD